MSVDSTSLSSEASATFVEQGQHRARLKSSNSSNSGSNGTSSNSTGTNSNATATA